MGKTILLEFKKDNKLANYILEIFSIIDEATSTYKDYKIGNKIFMNQKKEDSEIFLLDEDWKPLRHKLHGVIFPPGQMVAIDSAKLTLSEEESILFRKCAYAAFWFVTSPEYTSKVSSDDIFIKFHKDFFGEDLA